MTIHYQIQFLSDWHCGSGLSSGAEADAEVLKDENKLPYIPGKTIKGLLKDALLEMCEANSGIEQHSIDGMFGLEIKKDEKVVGTKNGSAFFSNATLSTEEIKEISPAMAEFMYRNIASTAIEKTGVAEKKSLRSTEVCMPVILHGTIDGVEEQETEIIIKAAKWVRHIGVKRNRGLGRCRIIVQS